MKNAVFFWLIIIISLLTSCKTNKCDTLLEKKITIESLENRQQFLDDFKLLCDCYFEEIDYQIIVGTDTSNPSIITTTAILLLVKPDTALSFNSLKTFIEEFKKTDDYFKIKKIVETQNDLFSRTVKKKTWAEDSVLVSTVFTTKYSQDAIRNLVFSGKNEGLLYSELFATYKDSIFEKAEEINPDEDQIPTNMHIMVGGLLGYNNLDTGISEAQKENKNILLYFSAYGSVSCRQMESKVIMQPDILNHIKNNLIIVDLITDYKNELPEKDQYYSEALEKDVVNTGLLACDIQITKFNTNSQPFWVLLTPSGSEIRRISYTSDPDEFRKFLFSE